MFRAIILAVSLCCLSPAQSFAATESHREATEKLLVLMNVPGMLDQLDSVFTQAMSQTFAASNPPPEARPLLEKYLNRMSEIMAEELSWDTMKNLYIDIYVDSFSEAEINELAVFFASPIGKKYTDKTPEMMQKASAESQSLMVNMQKRIQQLMQEMVQELETQQ